MPELPEVETVVRSLAPVVTGRTITGMDVRYPGCLVPVDGKSRLGRGDPDAFRERVLGRTIQSVRRRAKNIVVELSGGVSLLVHLKMTGALLATGEEYDAHTHLVFHLDRGAMAFRDPRKFGYVLALSTGELAARLANVGPEPLELSPPDFAARAEGRRKILKSLLLDQSFIAGVGNIYADEACHAARLRPDAKACDLSPAQLERLHQELQAVLRRSIAENGSSFRDYVDAKGRAGAFQNSFRVYGRAGQPCLSCGALLSSATVAGRTTVYCATCQAKSGR